MDYLNDLFLFLQYDRYNTGRAHENLLRKSVPLKTSNVDVSMKMIYVRLMVSVQCNTW